MRCPLRYVRCRSWRGWIACGPRLALNYRLMCGRNACLAGNAVGSSGLWRNSHRATGRRPVGVFRSGREWYAP